MPAARNVRTSRDADADERQPVEREPAAVEDRDHDDRADVVDHREREQQHAQRARDARAEQREHADRERDVGRHRDGPTRRACAADVEDREDRRRTRACRRARRRAGAPPCAGVASSPSKISRRISRPTTKKNTVIKPSLIQKCNECSTCHGPMRPPIGVCHRPS